MSKRNGHRPAVTRQLTLLVPKPYHVALSRLAALASPGPKHEKISPSALAEGLLTDAIRTSYNQAQAAELAVLASFIGGAS